MDWSSRKFVIVVVGVACVGWGSRAPAIADDYKIEAVKDAPPATLPAALKEAIGAGAYKVSDSAGNAFATVWLRKSVPASAKPAGPNGNVLYPALAPGELVGIVSYAAEGHDYRDQSIAAGVYTMRYALQPVNGDHLGVSPTRDYVLLVQAAKDTSVAPIPQKGLETKSADAAGSNHPAVLLLQQPGDAAAKDAAAMIHDAEKNLWSAVVPLSLAVKGETTPVTLRIQLVLVGAAMN